MLCFRATEIYSGEEASEFIHICIEKMETEDPGKLSKTLNDIIQRSARAIKSHHWPNIWLCGLHRGCHAVQFGHNTCTTCIFELLEKACIHLAELSLGSEQTPGSRRIYRSLVWGKSIWIREEGSGCHLLIICSLCGTEVSHGTWPCGEVGDRPMGLSSVEGEEEYEDF